MYYTLNNVKLRGTSVPIWCATLRLIWNALMSSSTCGRDVDSASRKSVAASTMGCEARMTTVFVDGCKVRYAYDKEVTLLVPLPSYGQVVVATA